MKKMSNDIPLPICMALRLGRRGAVLQGLGVIFLIQGYAISKLCYGPPCLSGLEPLESLKLFLSLRQWALIWATVGAIGFLASLVTSRGLQSLAFGFMPAVSAMWGVGVLLGYHGAGLTYRGITSGGTWASVAILIFIISGWKEESYLQRKLLYMKRRTEGG